MGFFSRLFGKSEGQKPNSTPDNRTTSELANDPNMIRVYDKYGREMFITRDNWRNSVLM